MAPKIEFHGTIISVQPRIRLLRSFDQRHHSYLGYVLALEGSTDDETQPFSVAIGKAAHAKHQFQIGMQVSGEGVQVADSRLETADLYKVSKLMILTASSSRTTPSPPWRDIAPELTVYRERGHRRLDARTYGGKCTTCVWGSRMPVERVKSQLFHGLEKLRDHDSLRAD